VAAAHVTTVQVFKGVVPFIIADIFVIALVIAVPALVLFLPGLL
jgi:TRAP-type mannitol/chloroaromatic compound transport system permease large subunit